MAGLTTLKPYRLESRQPRHGAASDPILLFFNLVRFEQNCGLKNGGPNWTNLEPFVYSSLLSFSEYEEATSRPNSAALDLCNTSSSTSAFI